MAQPPEGLSGMHERLLRLENGYEKVTEKQDAMGTQLNDVDSRLKWNEREVKEVKSDIKEIKGDTTWLRRTFTAAIITTLSTGVIGGGIAVIWNLVGK